MEKLPFFAHLEKVGHPVVIPWAKLKEWLMADLDDCGPSENSGLFYDPNEDRIRWFASPFTLGPGAHIDDIFDYDIMRIAEFWPDMPIVASQNASFYILEASKEGLKVAAFGV